VTTTVDAWTALGDPTRRGIFARLAERPHSVTDLATDLPVSRPAVSQHLRVLKEAGLVRVQPVGRHHIYRAHPQGLAQLRSELDAFWGAALDNFKQMAEQEQEDDREH
jgi:DNA-binding transcriptional ArsR family regulator